MPEQVRADLPGASLLNLGNVRPESVFRTGFIAQHASQQAFLEAHERAFAYFGGVFKKLRYDNLRSAMKKILRGHQREETTRFIAFRSHWDFESEFCTPAEGHEKGGVEGEGGYFRRNHMVPVPNVASWEELDALLLGFSKEDEQRIIGERRQTVGAGMLLEREHLKPLKEGFDLAAIHHPKVNASGPTLRQSAAQS